LKLKGGAFFRRTSKPLCRTGSCLGNAMAERIEIA
jgi:hypothetical protein